MRLRKKKSRFPRQFRAPDLPKFRQADVYASELIPFFHQKNKNTDPQYQLYK